MFVAKFASDARFSWVSQCGTSKGDELRAIALGADSIYIGGQTLGAWPGETHLNGLWDAWVMQLDSKGNRTWVDQFGEGEVDNVLGLAVGFGANHLLVGGAMDRHLAGRVQDAFFRLYDSRETCKRTSSLETTTMITEPPWPLMRARTTWPVQAWRGSGTSIPRRVRRFRDEGGTACP